MRQDFICRIRVFIEKVLKFNSSILSLLAKLITLKLKMMKTQKILFAIAAFMLIISGCIPSLHPLYTEGDLLFDKELLGTWKNGDETWVFTAEDENTYHLKILNQEDTTNLFVHMIELGGFRFLDFYPADNDHVDIPDNLIMNLLPVHTFARFQYDKKNFEVGYFDPEWLQKLFEQNRIRIRHEVVEDGNIVLTAPTEELQKFVAKYADDKNAYTGSDQYTKVL